MKLKILIILILAFITLSCTSEPQVCFDNSCVNVEIADTLEEKSIGLSSRSSLDEGTGMLFLYEEEGIYSFWMKDVLIPLDIIWVSKDYKIVHMEKAEPCENECTTLTPSFEALYVVETNSGFIEENSLEIGDSMIITESR